MLLSTLTAKALILSIQMRETLNAQNVVRKRNTTARTTLVTQTWVSSTIGINAHIATIKSQSHDREVAMMNWLERYIIEYVVDIIVCHIQIGGWCGLCGKWVADRLVWQAWPYTICGECANA